MGIRQKIKDIKKILILAKIRPVYFFIQLFILGSAAVFEGLSMVLLAPLAKGIIEQNFTFLVSLPGFSQMSQWFPRLLENTPNQFLFFLLIVVILLAAAAKNILVYIGALHLAHWKGICGFNIKSFVFKRYLKFGKKFFDRSSQGYVPQIFGFIEGQLMIFEGISSVLLCLCTMFIYIIIMLKASWLLTLITILVTPLYLFVVNWLIKKIRKTGIVHAKISVDLGKEVFNIISCMSLVKAYGREKSASIKFDKLNNQLRKVTYSMDKKAKLVYPLHEMFTTVFVLFLMSIIALVFVKGKAGVLSHYILFLILARRLIPLFKTINDYSVKLARTKGEREYIVKILSDEGKFIVPQGEKIFEGLEKGIKLKGLTFSYLDGQKILKKVDFSIEKGKITAIVGPTGAGKTTIINLLMRFYDCPSEAIFFDDIDIRKFTLKSTRGIMALVSQNTELFNDTLKNNIIYGLEKECLKEEIDEVIKRAKLDDFVNKLPNGLETEIGDKGIKLSGGERQRVSVARALLRNSEILILDEATSALDTHTEKFIQEAIEEAVRGRTTIVIAHRLSTIKNADKIIVIDEGKVLEQGGLEELISKKGKFYRYWNEQKFY